MVLSGKFQESHLRWWYRRTPCHWTYMRKHGLSTQLAATRRFQEEQALGWGQPWGWQMERKKGSWALEPIRHWPALPLDCPCEPANPLADIYLSWFLLVTSQKIHTSSTLYFALPNFTSDVDLLSLCSRPPGEWMFFTWRFSGPSQRLPSVLHFPRTYEIYDSQFFWITQGSLSLSLPIPPPLDHFPPSFSFVHSVTAIPNCVELQTLHCFMCLWSP